MPENSIAFKSKTIINSINSIGFGGSFLHVSQSEYILISDENEFIRYNEKIAL